MSSVGGLNLSVGVLHGGVSCLGGLYLRGLSDTLQRSESPVLGLELQPYCYVATFLSCTCGLYIFGGPSAT